jgi:hypothetical protein
MNSWSKIVLFKSPRKPRLLYLEEAVEAASFRVARTGREGNMAGINVMNKFRTDLAEKLSFTASLCGVQGCQIFLDTIYQNEEKIYQLTAL